MKYSVYVCIGRYLGNKIACNICLSLCIMHTLGLTYEVLRLTLPNVQDGGLNKSGAGIIALFTYCR